MTDTPKIIQARNLADEGGLIELYEAPRSGPWIRANFVASVDGAIATNGTSSGLTTPLDQQVLHLLRELADVVLVGAGTIRAEDYIGIRVSDAGQQRRIAAGMSPVPPIAVVTGRADISPASRLLTNTLVPPIVLTTTDADTGAKRELERAGATVIELGSGSIEPAAMVGALTSLGLTKVTCEGGPILAGHLAADNALDELCLTTVPIILGGTANRVTAGRFASLRVRCQHIILDTDGAQLARWVRN